MFARTNSNPRLKQVLIVDDDFNDDVFHLQTLKEMEIAETVKVVYDGQEAMEYLNKTGLYADEATPRPMPEIIFLDTDMPRMNGWEFLNKFKSPNGQPSVIMMTNSLDSRQEKQAKRNRLVLSIIEKPLTPEKIEQSIQTLRK